MKPLTVQPGPTLESSRHTHRTPLAEALTSPVVLLFHPGVGMGLIFPELQGCTSQLCGLNSRLIELRASGARVYGVSTMPVARNAAFAREHGIEFELLSDPAGDLGGLLSVRRERHGDTEVYQRVTVILRPNGDAVTAETVTSTGSLVDSILTALPAAIPSEAEAPNTAADRDFSTGPETKRTHHGMAEGVLPSRSPQESEDR